MIYISQPTFFPWIGYFSYLLKCEKLIFLDDVQFSKRSWHQRNRILINQKIDYITLPVKSKGLYSQKLNNTEISSVKSLDKIFETIRHNYNKSKFFIDIFNELEKTKKSILLNDKLSEINIKFIKKLCVLLDIKIQFITSSDLKVDGIKSEKLINICKKLNQNTLLNNEGSIEYIKNDLKKFKKNKINLEFYKYEPINYSQNSKKFEHSLSIIDLLFNEGPKSKEILLKGLTQINLN